MQKCGRKRKLRKNEELEKRKRPRKKIQFNLNQLCASKGAHSL
jgi:hypothetical protein